MIKASGRTGDGKPLIFLGLSGENVARLAADEPVFVRPEEMAAMGLPEIAIAIVYGTTEDDIVKDLREAGVSAPMRDLRDKEE